VLVGRSVECERIDRLLMAARAGRSGALLVHGEAGVGKTALLEYGRSEADGMTVLGVRGLEAEAQLAFAGLEQLLSGVLDRITVGPARQHQALAGALGRGPATRDDRFVIYAATLSALASVAADHRTLVLVDDMQWLDAPSAEALAFTARRLGAEGLAIIFSRRDGDDLHERSGVELLELGGLDAGSAAELLRSRASGPVSTSVAELLHRATAGNPLALCEQARLLTAAQLRGEEAVEEPVPVGRNLDRALRRRLVALPFATRRALVVAAASRSGAMAEVSRALGALGITEGALDAAEADGIVALRHGTLTFVHPLMRSAAYYSDDPAARRAAHRALADALVDDTTAASRAWHLAAAAPQPDEEVAQALEHAAVQARARGAPAASADAWEAAARLTPDVPSRVRRLIEAGRDLHLAGRAERALAALEQALDVAGDPLVRADIQHLRARVELFRGAPARTHELLVSAAEDVQPLDPVRAGMMLADAAFTAITRAHPREALALARRAVSVAGEIPVEVRAALSISLGSALILCGEAADGYAVLLQAEPLAHSDDLFTASTASVALASGHVWLERYEKAAGLLGAVVARLRRAGAVSMLPYPLAALADAERLRGNWQSAYASATESVTLAEDVGQHSELGLSVAQLALVEAGMGRAAECRVTVARALEIAGRLELGSVVHFAGGALGLLELGEGRLDEAIALLDRIGRAATAVGVGEPSVVPWAQDLAEAYVRAGRREEADETLVLLAAQAQRTGRRSAHAAVARCRGLMAETADEVDARFAEALAWHRQESPPFERARTDLCFGERLRRARRRADARTVLRRALETFDALGARSWAARARAELAATGERARPREPSAAERLTAQELQVAMIVANGSTNNEAAAALFVSPKTIEAHLTHIYRKLGLRSRTELAGLVRGAAHDGDRVIPPAAVIGRAEP
jgi:DNA-binding CsgD family transcriptional regulator